MRRSASAKADCSAAGAQTATANPERLARSATATATGLEPQITICGRGKIGSTKMSMVPLLGHIFSAKRTPPSSSHPPSRRSPLPGERKRHAGKFAVGDDVEDVVGVLVHRIRAR
jgi:hypothetical protein